MSAHTNKKLGWIALGFVLLTALLLWRLMGDGGELDLGAAELVEALEEPRPDNEVQRRRREPKIEEKKGEASGEEAVTGPIELPAPFDLDAADRDHDIFGLILDHNGAPVAGALVTAGNMGWWRGGSRFIPETNEVIEQGRSFSAEDGSFRIRLRRGQSATLQVRADGFADVTLVYCPAGQRQDIVLYPAARLEVFCLSADGEAVPYAKVKIFMRGSINTSHRRRMKTDRYGSCVFEGLPPGKFQVVAMAPQYGARVGKAVILNRGESQSVEVQLRGGRGVTGIILDEATGDPIKGAKIASSRQMFGCTESDETGRYLLPYFNGGKDPRLHVTAEGYGRQSKLVPLKGEINFQLEPGDVLRGRLLRNGKPVDRAYVHVMGSSRGQSVQVVDACGVRSGSDGRFEVGSLSHDFAHILMVDAEGAGRFILRFDPRPGEAGVIDVGDLSLPAARLIEGKVIDSFGQALSGVEVRLNRGTPGFPYSLTERRRTDDLGRYRFRDLSSGRYELRLMIDGGREQAREVAVFKDADTLNVDFEVEGRESIDVVCLDPDGLPLSDVLVGVFSRGRGARSRNVRTDAEGRAHLRYLVDAEHSLRAHRGHRKNLAPMSARDVRPGGPPVRLQFERAARLEGRLVGPDGFALTHYVIKVSWDGAIRANSTSNGLGEFAIDVPAGKKATLTVTGRRLAPGTMGMGDPEGDRMMASEVLVSPVEGVVIRAKLKSP